MAPVRLYKKKTSQWFPDRFGGAPIPIDTDPGGFLPGVHKPGPTNTGLRNYGIPGKPALTEVYPASGNSITLAAGTYTGRRFWGILKASGPITLNDCRTPGPDPLSWSSAGGSGQPSYGCVQNYGSNPPLIKMNDCVMDPGDWLTAAAPGGARAALNPYNIGWHGGQGEILRCEITNVSDAINFIGPNGSLAIAQAGHFLLQQCWVHKGLYSNDLYPPNDGQPHCDGFQTNYGRNITLWGNTIGGQRVAAGYNVWPGNAVSPGQGYNAGDDFWNAGLMLKQENFAVSTSDPRYPDRVEIAKIINLVIKENWFAGGTCTVNIATDTLYGGDFSSWQIIDNRFATRGSDWGKTMRGYAKGDGGFPYNSGAGTYVLRNASTFAGELTGNINEQTGSPITISPGA